MPWGEPLNTPIPDKPPNDSKDLSVQVKPFLFKAKDVLNLLLAQQLYFVKATTGGAVLASATNEDWNDDLFIEAVVGKHRTYLIFAIVNVKSTDVSPGDIVFQITDDTATSALAWGGLTLAAGTRGQVILATVFNPEGGGKRKFNVVVESSAINAEQDGLDILAILEVPRAD